MPEQEKNCLICRVKKSFAACELCEAPVCKNCVQRLSEESFEFATAKDEILKHTRFCPQCFDSKISPLLDEYNATLERAKEVVYLPKTYQTYVHVVKRAKSEVSIDGCDDRDRAILHLGFKAAEQGYNALILAEVKCRKSRNAGYQKSIWSGHATPANIDEKRLKLEEYREEVWRRGY